jgi:hypothetical protein
MGNVLEKAKQEQVIALGRLGWSLRRIEAATDLSGTDELTPIVLPSRIGWNLRNQGQPKGLASRLQHLKEKPRDRRNVTFVVTCAVCL